MERLTIYALVDTCKIQAVVFYGLHGSTACFSRTLATHALTVAVYRFQPFASQSLIAFEVLQFPGLKKSK